MAPLARLYFLTVVGVGAYPYSNTGVQDIALRKYHFTGVPDWMPVAVMAAVILFLFLLHVIYASVRIGMLRRSNGKTSPMNAPHPLPR